MAGLSVVLFDVNGTLSDMGPLAQRFASVGAPEHLARTWFASALRDGFGLAAAGASQPFAAIASSVLRGVLREAAVQDLEPAVDHVMAGFSELDVHDDVPGGVRALRQAGLRLLTLTNGSVQTSQALLERAGILDQFERLLSVEQAGVWKPARAAYEYAGKACGVPLTEMLLVAAHPWDIEGAARAGLQTAWLNRSRAVYPDHQTAPERTASSVTELAELVSH
jgi:2-haloacid dehalogenase